MTKTALTEVTATVSELTKAVLGLKANIFYILEALFLLGNRVFLGGIVL